MNHTEMAEAQDAPIPSLPSRIVKVFFSPGQLFEALRNNPAWGGALLTAALVVAVSMAAIPTDIWEQYAQEQVRQAQADDPEVGGGVFRLIAVGGGFLGTYIFTIIVTALYALVFKVFMGGEGSFRHYLSLTSHSALIVMLGTLVTIPMKISQADPELTLNLGTLAPFLEEGLASRFLGAMDLFGIWAAIVVAIGVTKIAPRISFAAALGGTLGITVVFSLFGAWLGGFGGGQ